MDLKISEVCKSIGNKKILNNLSLTLMSGECLGLVGPNGSGKTTLIRVILGLYNYEGEVLISSKSRDKIEMNHEKILFILDTSGLLRNLNVSENIEFFHRIYNPSATAKQRNEVVEFILQQINLQDYKNKKIKELSRGMKQRLAIGRTMVVTPKLLIMDEPYLGLDVEAQIFLTDYIKDLKKKGCTIMISSHDLGHLEKVCDRVAFISKGSILNSEKMIGNGMSLEDTYKKIFIKG